MNRTLKATDGLLAATVLLGTPLALFFSFGIPWSTKHGVSFAIRLALCLAWAVWFWCLLGVIRSTQRRVRTKDLALSSGTRGFDRLAVRLAALFLALATMAPPPAGAKSATATPPPPPVTMTASASSWSPASSQPYTVVAGDSLWVIAERLYGDGTQWRRLADTNLGHVMNDGRLFLDPSLIYPGWSLRRDEQQQLSVSAAPLMAPETAPAIQVPVAPPSKPPTARHGVPASLPSELFVAPILGGGVILLSLLRRRKKRTTPSRPVQDADLALRNLPERADLTLLERAIVLSDHDGVLTEPGILRLDEDGARLFRSGVQRWRATPHDLMTAQDATSAPVAVVPLGDDGATSWSLLIPPGSIAEIGGDRAADHIADVERLQQSFAWGHFVLDSPADEFAETGSLFFGTATANYAAPPRHALVRLVHQADVMVTASGFSIASLSVHHESEGLSNSSRALLDDPGEAPSLNDVLQNPPPLEQGSVTIRLLCAQPRIEGLAQPIDSKRERRAIEVVTYVRMHGDEPVTGDRLRTRVLGTAKADAASKTLFNVVSAARRALGLDDHGVALFPPATRTGLYRISREVHLDLEQLFAHVAAAEDASSDDDALAHLRAGLDLIESEPFAATLTGWDWFLTEGHRGRLDLVVELCARQLVTLALRQGLTDLARHGLDQARLVLPYSELLAEAAMEVAASEGDTAALRRAFDDLGRVTEELDPGSWPTPAAEDRFRALRESMATQASLAAIDAAPRRTSPSAPAAL